MVSWSLPSFCFRQLRSSPHTPLIGRHRSFVVFTLTCWAQDPGSDRRHPCSYCRGAFHPASRCRTTQQHYCHMYLFAHYVRVLLDSFGALGAHRRWTERCDAGKHGACKCRRGLYLRGDMCTYAFFVIYFQGGSACSLRRFQYIFHCVPGALSSA